MLPFDGLFSRYKTYGKRELLMNEQPAAQEFLSVAQFAQILAVSQKLVRDLIKDGRVHASQVGRLLRIHISELEQFKRPNPQTQ